MTHETRGWFLGHLKDSAVSPNKRVCIVTWRGSSNFGSNLQAYALHRKLEVLGYHICILSEVPNFSCRYWIQYILSVVGIWQVLRWLKFKYLDVSTPTRKTETRIEAWGRRVFNGVRIKFPWQLHRLVKQTECFVTGSDQIWNTYCSFDPTMYLAFAGNRKRVAYASSVGTASINPDCSAQMNDWLLKFNHLSLREKSGVNLIAELTGRTDVVQVCDPTFLLTARDWDEISQQSQIASDLSRPFIACYLLSKNPAYTKYLADVCNHFAIARVVIVPACENPDFYFEGAEVFLNADPADFVKILASASLICTDSFHASALCINIEKPFVEFLRFSDQDPYSQNSRIYDLLHHYHLVDRLYHAESNAWQEPLDFTKSRQILATDRERSLKYLVNAIEN